MASSAIHPAPPRTRPVWRWAILLAAAVALVLGAGLLVDRNATRDAAVPLDPATLRPGYGPATYAAALDAINRRIASARRDIAEHPGEWLRNEALARALMTRWRLAGDYADLAEADRLLDQGVAEAPDPSGPVLSRALLSVMVHRLGQAEVALARQDRSAAPESADTADAAALRSDIAVQRGELRRAAELIARAQTIAGSPGTGLRGAIVRAQRGDHAGAAAALDALLRRPRQQPGVLADMMIQRASLAYWTGDWAGAGRWIGAAQRVFPGYWLADAYAAQQFALAGRTAEAIRAYTILARRTDRPEVMDALAHLLRLQGDAGASRAWAARAQRKWQAEAALFPEAVIHHQVEHELAVGSATQALVLAARDAAARPQAPNQVLLARALLSAGRPAEALAALDKADAQGWVSAGQAMARAEVEAALGNTGAAQAARERAEAINPRAADPRTRLIWFGHD